MAFARSMCLQQAADEQTTCDCHDGACDEATGEGLHSSLCLVSGLGTVAVPVRANARSGGRSHTAVLKMYLTDSYDGHFVLFEHTSGPADYSGFFGSARIDQEGMATLFE